MSGAILLSEVIGALSYALDLTEGEPPGHAQRSCLIGMRLAHELRLDSETRSDLFYALLLKDAGCTANASRMSALFGADDHELKRTGKRTDWARKLPAFVWSVRAVAPKETPRVKLERLLAIKDEGEVTRSLMQARCDRGAEIARLIGLTDGTAEAIRTLDEHWDGHGQPRWLLGEQIPLLGRILCLAQTVEIFHAAGGVDDAYAVAERRAGTWFDPDLVKALDAFRRDAGFWASLAEPDLTRWEPEDQLIAVDDERLLQIATAFAAIVDAKSPWTYFHSDRTSLIATNMGAALGLDSGRARRPAAHGAAARHRKAGGLQPDPRQAVRADGRRVRADQGAPAVHALGARAGELLRGRSRRRRPATTSGSTAAATRAG